MDTKITTDHDQIRRWAEEQGGKPSCVAGTGSRKMAGERARGESGASVHHPRGR